MRVVMSLILICAISNICIARAPLDKRPIWPKPDVCTQNNVPVIVAPLCPCEDGYKVDIVIPRNRPIVNTVVGVARVGVGVVRVGVGVVRVGVDIVRKPVRVLRVGVHNRVRHNGWVYEGRRYKNHTHK